MDTITIKGVRPYDGTYDFDLEQQPLTTREWGWIKRLAGYLPLNIEDGLTDPELIVVFAAISLRRAGKVEAREVPEAFGNLSDAPFGSSVTMDMDKTEDAEEGEAVPPAGSSSLNGDTSGPSSSRSSETLRKTQPDYGMQGSATSESDSLRLAN